MQNRDNELSESLVPAKDAVVNLEGAYVTYFQCLQKYYAFALTKAEIVFLSILLLAFTHSMHIHYSNFFLASEMLWIFIAMYIRCFWVPYPAEMLPFILLSLFTSVLLFAFFTWFFLYQPEQQQAQVTFILWLVSLIMYIPIIFYALCLTKNSFGVNKLMKEVQNCFKGKLKGVKVGRINNQDKKVKKQIRFGQTQQSAQPQPKIDSKVAVG